MKASFLAGAVSLGLLVSAPVEAQHQGHEMPSGPPPGAPGAPATPPEAPETDDMQGMEMPAGPRSGDRAMAGMAEMAGMAGRPGAHPMMVGALGPYSATREASGTAWQPDSSSHLGLMTMAGDWMLMGHGLLNLVEDRQSGRRGGDKLFVSGMAMAMAQRSFADGAMLQFKAMISPDSLMGKSGYPLLLASGETANGIDPLVDRQHPHDLFMELSASYSVKLSAQASLFLYGGLPGEPAFGPPAFMHRQSIMASPEAPITHHWLDSTHITFGVVTAGLVLGRFKAEASRFNGREPDQHRYDIEAGPLDSTALRLSVNPTPELSLQASWAHLKDPEQLAPGEDQTRWSASGIYTRKLGKDSWWSTTLAWGRRSGELDSLDAAALESAIGLKDWTLFGRAEYTENDELLFAAGHHGPAFEVAKLSLGLVRDFRIADRLKFGLGGIVSFDFVPARLEPLYGSDPHGAMAFMRLKLE